MPEVQFDIETIAKLSRLNLSDEEKASFETQLPSIVAYVSKLSEVDISTIEAKDYFTEQVNAFEPDEVKRCEEEIRDAIVDGFPQKTGGALEVPAVL
jgi:aspartyl/glutamyl-tRNA(Asn/Gln) amidotransferase C subunit